VLDNIQSRREVVVDARSAGRFRGSDPEPRPGLPSGHIPGSRSLPFTDLLLEGRQHGAALIAALTGPRDACACTPAAARLSAARQCKAGSLAAAGQRFKPVGELRRLFQGAGVELSAPVAVSCGSGLTACVVAAALYQATGQLAALYDGAWTEWASREGTPRATGEA
jgi:thiosulfate/3-mercaptopyruvate sulfurtransferase